MSREAGVRGILGATSCAALLATIALGCGSKDDAGNSSSGGDGDGDHKDTGGSGATSGDGDASGGALGTGGTPGGSGGSDSCPTALCNGSCVNTQTDDLNCGECGQACDEHHACQEGQCIRVTCPGTLTVCDEDCVDTEDSMQHCGACNDACALSFVCSSSDCACPADRSDCGGFCTHTDFDRHHCGGCASLGGVACEADEACVAGDCTTIPIPGESYCEDTFNWPIAYTALEFQILDLVNQRRAEGATCGDAGYFPPAGPLQMDSSLRCSARMHSMDMATRNYFSHNTIQPEGYTPRQRMELAGYTNNGWGENIAAGNSTAAQTMQQWMNSPGHCSGIMNSNYTLIGVGYYPGMGAQYGHYWTQNFGRN